MAHDNKTLMDMENYFVGKINGAFSWFDMAGLKTGCDRLKDGDVYVEVGTQHGRSAYVAASMLPAGVKMFCVDIFDPPSGPDTMSRKDFFKSEGLDKRITYINEPSDKAAADWDGTPIDMMFIDADHSYEGVKLDVDSWAPFVKSGGYIYFHDADDTSPGVERLVKELGASKAFTDLTFYKDTLQYRTSLASIRKV